jgi:phosphomevalonate kinase
MFDHDVLQVLEIVGPILLGMVGVASYAVKIVNRISNSNHSLQEKLINSYLDTQSEMLKTLQNHFHEDLEVQRRISEHMGTTNEVLRSIQLLLVVKPKD